MQVQQLKQATATLKSTELMPVLFLGHGNPMNAIEHNAFTEGFHSAAQHIPKPSAILCISAHWETRGSYVTAMEKPPTIHDFGGFPKALFDVQYPAPGSPELAAEVQSGVHRTRVEPDERWGLDHGTWSVLIHLFPKADIPVVQLSLDYRQDPQYHYELARELAFLRRKGVLIVGSGNLVHNLGMVDWQHPEHGYEWAETANASFKKLIADNDYRALVNYRTLGREVALSVPTPEHYLPALYALALRQEREDLRFFNDQCVMGSIAMTSFLIA